jgi:hypothetical protein
MAVAPELLNPRTSIAGRDPYRAQQNHADAFGIGGDMRVLLLIWDI